MIMMTEIFTNRTPGLIGEAQIRHSAVCIPLIETAPGEYDILLTVRSSAIDSQPGDVCLPGGMMEEGETSEQGAVREAMEELLIHRQQLRVIGPADIFAGSQLYIHPFVTILTDYENTFSTDEVAEVFRVPLRFFLEQEPERHRTNWHVEMKEDFPFDKIVGGRNYRWRERKEEVLFYEYDGHVIWGITAKILHAFADTLSSGISG